MRDATAAFGKGVTLLLPSLFLTVFRSWELKSVGLEDTHTTAYFGQKLLNSPLEGQTPQLPPYLGHSFLSLMCNKTDRQHLA